MGHVQVPTQLENRSEFDKNFLSQILFKTFLDIFLLFFLKKENNKYNKRNYQKRICVV